MEVGTKLFGAPSSIASFSITSNPSQNVELVGIYLLDADLFIFFTNDVMLPPLLFVPYDGEFDSLNTKFELVVKEEELRSLLRPE